MRKRKLKKTAKVHKLLIKKALDEVLENIKEGGKKLFSDMDREIKLKESFFKVRGIHLEDYCRGKKYKIGTSRWDR